MRQPIIVKRLPLGVHDRKKILTAVPSKTDISGTRSAPAVALHLLGAQFRLLLDGRTLAYHEVIFLALLLQVGQSTRVAAALKLFPSPNDALQPTVPKTAAKKRKRENLKKHQVMVRSFMT